MGWGKRRHALFLAVLTTLVIGSVMAAGPVTAGPKIPGIDVSKYQGAINWPKVASTPVTFVIMRATKGNAYVDPRYATNLAGADANGLVVGAYHFAKPGPAAWDARAEADHFVDVARNAAGDILPVLDVEETGGLNTWQLRAWARTWLDRVRSRTGVRPMIYTGDHFWSSFMGDTRRFADDGHPLWVAHWYVSAPDLPADRWGGHRWTFWQWSATGRIAGIAGDVDRDWFRGADLTRGRIASLNVTPAHGGLISGERIACGAGQTRCGRLAGSGDRLTLTATPVPDAEFLSWTGACASAGTAPTCTVTALGDRTVSAVFAHPIDGRILG